MRRRHLAVLTALCLPWALGQAQETANTEEPAAGPAAEDEEVIVLSPFEVSSGEAEGYNAATTLAGNRLNTQLRDVGSAVSVVTDQFLKDTGAVNNATLLQYTPSTEVGGVYGNFAGLGDAAQLNESTNRPNENTRVRGLAAADNTRDFFRTEIPWDAYNVDRVDLQRGPNSILFGQGSPAGIINTGTRGANFRDSGSVEFRFGSHGSTRAVLDLNHVLVDDQVAFRVSALRNADKFQQEPAFATDERLYGAVRIEPAFLNRGSARTIFKANFETGKIDSNRPRELPPSDYITPWFGTGAAGLNQATYSGSQLWDHLSGRINSGQERDAGYNAPNSGPIPYFQPWIGGFGTSGGPEPVAFFDGDGQTLWITEVSAPLQTHGLRSDGTIDGNIAGFVANPGRMRAINGTALWSSEAHVPYSAAGIFKDNLLSDPSIFDFYNQLIDGDTKREWQDFHSATANLTQTFFDDRLGFSFDYNKEHYNSGQVALLGGRVQLNIDPMAVFADGTPDAGQNALPFSDGTPNPNVGRPFVSSTVGSNNSFTSDREASRVTAFVTHDFAREKRTWLTRILGAHTLTGLVADDEQKTDSRAWQRYGYFTDTAYAIEQLNPALNAFNAAALTPTQVIYLGPSLLGESVTGAHIPSIAGNPAIASGQIRYFDDHWNRPTDPTAPGYVNPAAPWTNYFYTGDPSKLAPGQPGFAAGMISTQSENPANYRGWTTAQLDVTDSEAAPGNRDKLTRTAALRKSLTTSQALVWQGRMLDQAIVGTYGWRKDINKSWSLDRNVGGSTKQIDFDDYELASAADARVEVQSRAYSVVAHLMDLPGVKQWTEQLPFEISLSYNMSTNFKPDASRVDILGLAIPSPSGKTIDKGIVIATRDARYSFKVNRYETAVKNGSSAGAYGLGSDINNWFGHGAIYANVFEYDIGNWEWARSPSNYRAGYDTTDRMRYDYYVAGQPDTTGDEARAIAAYRAFQAKVDPRFWAAWGYESLEHVQSGEAIHTVPSDGVLIVPAGFAVTEDTVSKGWEFEFNAEPVKNWRFSLNATKSTAVRNNVGGENMRTLMDLIATEMEGDAGRLHFWWGTDDVPRARAGWYNYNNNPGAQWASRKLLEGTNVPELREWRVNLITNYDIASGYLKGVNVGGGMRYQSSVVIGFPPMGDPNDAAEYAMDLSRPYEGPSETNFDFWVGYRRKLTDKIDWRFQLNVQNLFNGDELIPITAQAPIHLDGYDRPDGTPAAYRIAPARTWFVTNTFEF